MTKKEIKEICEYYNIENYVINDYYSVDVISNVDLSHKDLNEIPIKFRFVHGCFDVDFNNLTSLKNSPEKVGWWFSASYNKLSNIKNLPQIGSGYVYNLLGNPLTSLDGFKGNFNELYCSNKEKLIRKLKLDKLLKEL